MKKLLLTMLGVLMVLPAMALVFTYEYEGQTLTYTIISETDKTCQTKAGDEWKAGNYAKGNLIIPAIAKDGQKEYTVIAIGDYGFNNRWNLTSVIIPNTVTTIGEHAFWKCSDMKSVVIGSSTTSIGNNAFDGCRGLTELTIPNSVTTIGESAFRYCNKLTELTIPNSMTFIAKTAFYGCSGLTELTIPNSVTSIGEGAFEGCSGLIELTIPNSVTSIGNAAFRDCVGLTELTLSNSLTSIGYSAFSGCSGLTELTIPNSVTSTGNAAFRDCVGLTELTLSNSLTSIDTWAFEGCSGLTELTIPNTVTYIGYSAFSNCSGLTELTIPNSVTTIDNYAFRDCVGLTELTLSNSLTTIGEGAFGGCSRLKSVVIPPSVTSVGVGAFNGCSGLVKSAFPNCIGNPFYGNGIRVGYPAEGAIIEDGWVYGPEKSAIYFAPYTLEGEYTVAESVKSIGDNAFKGCNGLTQLSLGSSVTNIGVTAFSNCSMLKSIFFQDGKSEIIIEREVFQGANNIESIYIGRNLSNIGYGQGSPFSRKESIRNVTFSDSVTSIADYLFYRCNGIASVTIPNSVISIGLNAFSECKGLENLIIGDAITSIDASAFSGCSRLTQLSIGNSLSSIGESAFKDCSALTTLILPKSLKTIGSSAFNNCIGLSELILPDSVTSIGSSAFYGCKNIIELTIGNSVDSIGDSAFEGCGGLKSVIIPNSVTSVGSGAFRGCSSITKLSLGNLITSIGDAAFSDCSELKSVVIPNFVTSVGKDAFYGCAGLVKAAYPDSMENPFKIGVYNKCVSVRYPAEGAIIEDGWVYGPEKSAIYFAPITFEGEYTVPESVKTIGNNAFNCCRELKSVIIPPSVTSVGTDAFKNCKGLVKSAYPNSIANPYEETISNLDGISVSYPAEGAIIENGFIYNSEKSEIYFAPYSLEGDYTLAESVRNIGENAFRRCRELTRVTIGSLVDSIGNDAFYETGLKEIITKALVVPYDVKSAFHDLYYSATLIVPAEAAFDYIATDPWSRFQTKKTPGGVIEYGSDDVFSYLYMYESKEAVIVKSPNYKNMSSIIIPRRVAIDDEFYNVVGIADDAFKSCNVESVTLGNEIRWIGNRAFSDCSSLRTVKFNPNLETIGDYAFNGCCISSINLMNTNVKSIGDYAFYGSNSVENLNFPVSLLTIGDYAFARTDEASISIYDYVKPQFAIIPEYYCLLSLTIPPSLSHIGKGAFSLYSVRDLYIDNLEMWCNITFGDEAANPLYINTLNYKSYERNVYVQGEPIGPDIVVPDGVKELKSYVFAGFDINSVTIPESVEHIMPEAFSGSYSITKYQRKIPMEYEYEYYKKEKRNYTNLEKLVIYDGNSPLTIDKDAFKREKNGLTSINDIYMGRSVPYFHSTKTETLKVGNLITEIPDDFFRNGELSYVTFGSALKSIGKRAFKSAGLNNYRVVIPPFVESIGAEAFANCPFESVAIGCGIKEIGDSAFHNSVSESVYMTALTPPAASNNSFNNYSSTLYVLKDAKDKYIDFPRCWYRFENNVDIFTAGERVETNISEIRNARPGDTYQLSASVLPAQALQFSVFWESSNPDVAKVDNFGKVTICGTYSNTLCIIRAHSLYSNLNGEVRIVTADSGIEDIEYDGQDASSIDHNQPLEVYTLNGQKVAFSIEGLVPGLYIVRQGSKVEKIIVK